MSITTSRLRVLTISAAVLLGLCADAVALNGFWHGVRSDNWHDGIQNGVSNWYSLAPAEGVPREVPDGTASFFPGAVRTTVTIDQPTSIRTMHFGPNVEAYDIKVDADTTVSGFTGIRNDAASTPKFIIGSGNQAPDLIFQRSARLVANGSGRAADIVNRRGGSVVFRNTSRGGTAQVTNAGTGELVFQDNASAQSMLIINDRRGRTLFKGRSTPANAEIRVNAGGLADLSQTLGPGGTRSITAGRINNNGVLRIGLGKLSKLNTLVLRPGGSLRLTALSRDLGSISARSATLSGTLVVSGNGGLPKQTRRVLIRSATAIVGKFDRVQFQGFGARQPRIVYQAKRVLLVVR